MSEGIIEITLDGPVVEVEVPGIQGPRGAEDAAGISFDFAGSIASTNVQDAIEELDSEKLAYNAELAALPSYIATASQSAWFDTNATGENATWIANFSVGALARSQISNGVGLFGAGTGNLGIGLLGVAFSGDADDFAFGQYLESVRGASGNFAVGSEIEIVNYGSDDDPEISGSNNNFALTLQSGGDASVHSGTNSSDAALVVGNNGNNFWEAFRIGPNALRDPGDGIYRAFTLLDKHAIRWNNAAVSNPSAIRLYGDNGVLKRNGNTVWDAGNDGSGSGLDADLLDGKNTGTSGNTIPLLDGANTWSGVQVISLAAAGVNFRIDSTDAGAGVGPSITHRRDSASPAASDQIGGVFFQGKDSGNNLTNYVNWFGSIIDPTDGSEDGEIIIQTVVAGSAINQMRIGNGVYLGGATGAYQGTGTLNATAVYDDGVLLTCMAMEFLETGNVDTDKWDALVPDRVIPKTVEQRPVMEEADVDEVRLVPDEDGGFIARRERKKIKKPAKEWIPIHDEHGNGIDAIEREVTEEIVHPEKVETRRHELAHRFKAMIDEGFDPRDPLAYIKQMKTDRALPGMPTEDEWRDGKKMSLGEIHSRLWLAVEMLALAFVGNDNRLAALEAKVG